MLFRQDPPSDGPTNMALDGALLAEAAPAVRLYEWVGPWVTLGRFQQPDRDLVSMDRVPWIVRPTGGKAVLHGHDWTVGLACPLSVLADEAFPAEKLARSVREVYVRVTKPLIASLRACGLNAALAEETPFANRGPRVADCFAHVAPNDLVEAETGAKVCGVALKLAQTHVLVQASIPKRAPLIDPAEVLVGASLEGPRASWNTQAFPDALQESVRIFFEDRLHP